MRTFNATAVAAEEIPDYGAYVVMLAERDDGVGARLEIQRSLEPADEDDRSRGWDTYCLCTEDGATHYGGIASWAIRGNELKLELDDAAAEELGVDDGFVIQLPRGKQDLVRKGLERVLG